MTVMDPAVDAFAGMYDEHVGTVCQFCSLRTGSRQLGQRLTAETFRRALRLDAPKGDPRPWLIGVARQVVADHLRRWPLEDPDVDLGATPEDLQLLALVHRLHPTYQDNLILLYLMGFTIAQTGQAMGHNERGVRTIQGRASRALARLLPEGRVP